jgi:hypothetical protein
MVANETPTPMEDQPWTVFHRIGEMRRGRLSELTRAPTADGQVSLCASASSRDTEGESRMADDGCPNP